MSDRTNIRPKQHRQNRNTSQHIATVEEEQADTPAPATPVTQVAKAGPPEPLNRERPWRLKDTSKWLVSLLRSHNTYLDSHLALRRTVTELRQDL